VAAKKIGGPLPVTVALGLIIIKGTLTATFLSVWKDSTDNYIGLHVQDYKSVFKYTWLDLCVLVPCCAETDIILYIHCACAYVCLSLRLIPARLHGASLHVCTHTQYPDCEHRLLPFLE